MTAGGAVDVHAHCVPAAVLERLTRDADLGLRVEERDGQRAVLVGGGRERRVDPGLLDLDARLAAMDRTGVAVQLLSSWMEVAATAFPETVAPRYARLFNDALAETAATAPDRFRALATVPLGSPIEAADELRRSVLELGMVGAEIGTTVAGRDLDDPALTPFWSAAEELRCIVLLHPCASLAGRGVTRHFLNNLVGNPAESTIAVGHLVFGGVLERHPGLRLVVVHGGGFAPYQLGRWDHAFHGDVRGATANLTRPPSHWVASMYHDTVLHSVASLRLLLDVVGVRQVVLGSDHPFEMGDPDPVGLVDRVPHLDPADRSLVLRGNMDRLLAEVAR